MIIMITYVDYVKLLENNNLKFYDYHKRISYSRLVNFFNIQRGGGIKKMKTLDELEPHNLEKVVLHSFNKNFDIIKYYFEN